MEKRRRKQTRVSCKNLNSKVWNAEWEEREKCIIGIMIIRLWRRTKGMLTCPLTFSSALTCSERRVNRVRNGTHRWPCSLLSSLFGNEHPHYAFFSYFLSPFLLLCSSCTFFLFPRFAKNDRNRFFLSVWFLISLLVQNSPDTRSVLVTHFLLFLHLLLFCSFFFFFFRKKQSGTESEQRVTNDDNLWC